MLTGHESERADAKMICAAGMERRSTTIVAADLVGYSQLMAANEESVISRLRQLRSSIIDPQVFGEGGRIIKVMGDGYLAEFQSPLAAVRAALAVQRAVIAHEATVEQDQKLRFRVGINYGDVVVDGDDVLGDVVNIAARLETISPPGGICVSRSVYEQVEGKIDAPLAALAPQYVKNIPAPVEAWIVQIAGVPNVVSGALKKSDRPSIAVLAFDNRSTDSEQGFLAEGISEDVINQLSRFRSLFVIARNSSFSYKGTSKDVRQIARELGVRYVVEGSVRRSGQHLRVSTELSEAETGAQIWSGRLDRTMQDLFDLQDEITRAIVLGVAPELGAHERRIARQKPTENLTAWELCQRGLAEYYTYTGQSYKSAHDLFTAAIKADPNFALPRALLGRWYAVKVFTGRSQDVAGDISNGLEYANASVALDDRLEDAHIALGSLLIAKGREADARIALDRAYALNDNNPMLFYTRTFINLFQQEPDASEMEAAARDAIQLSPKDPVAWAFHWMAAMARWFRDIENPDESFMEAVAETCQYPDAEYFPFIFSSIFNVRLGRIEEARMLLERGIAKRPDLTLATWRRSFHFPTWPRLVRSTEAELQKLVELGLPPE